MANAANIVEHMEVLSSDGKHVGTVDHMEGEDQWALCFPGSGAEKAGRSQKP